MTKQAYLTLDDSPTRHTDNLTDWLLEKNIPAVLFCIGSSYKDLHLDCEGIDQNSDPIRRAIEKGFVIGNHTLTHRRANELSYDEIIREIEHTEKMIEDLYKEAGHERHHKLMRFPHLDRGCGGWVVDYDAAGIHKKNLEILFGKGLNITLDPPSDEQVEKKHNVQDYLKREGYSVKAYKGVTFDWYQETEMAQAADSLYTFSTSDWMMNPDFEPYRKDWKYQSLEALKQKIDDDPWLHSEESVNIVLAHDHNNMFDVTTSLIDHMQKQNIEFLEIS